MSHRSLRPVSATRPVLVLGGTGMPLGAVPLSRAVSLVMTGRAATLASEGVIRSPSVTVPAPTVIVRVGWVAPLKGVHTRVTKSALLARDRWTCGWCGLPGDTIDHIVPRSRGGRHEWANVVTSCLSCNNDKGDAPPDWSSLRVRPIAPSRLLVLSRQLARLGRGDWDVYLPAA